MSGWWLRPHIRTCCAANSTRARTEHLPLCFCCWLLFGSFPSRAALMPAHARRHTCVGGRQRVCGHTRCVRWQR